MTDPINESDYVLIPIQIDAEQYSVFIMLSEANLERLQAYDPLEIPVQNLPERYQPLRLKDVIVGFASPSDRGHVMAALQNGEVVTAMRFLSRGFRFRPDLGDHDRGPERLG